MGDPTCDHKLVFTQLLVLTFVFVFRRLDIVHRRHCFRTRGSFLFILGPAHQKRWRTHQE